MTKINIPDTDQKRVVIIGAGFAGLTLARKLSKSNFQVVLLDKNNYHQFQPLFYQVAMAGLEPSSIAFPLRKIFQKKKNVFIRITKVERVDTKNNLVETALGTLKFDYLIIAIGATTNFFGNKAIEDKVIPMKSVSEALYLRNRMLDDYEKALTTSDFEKRQGLIDIVIVGGGPTGVEVAGALAEMKNFIIPKDYHELDHHEIDIYLIQGAPCLLKGMSEHASENAEKFLKDLGVKVITNMRVNDYDGEFVHMADGSSIRTQKVIWAAGITGNKIKGFEDEVYTYGSRFDVNRFNQIKGHENIFAIGDIAYMEEEAFPKGHPQVAQVAIQQGKLLAKNMERISKNEPFKEFFYKDLGSMATIGRNKAVCDLPKFKFKGFFAWVAWLVVHLFSLIGVKNKLFVFINWSWNYLTYDQSLRLIIKPKILREKDSKELMEEK